MTILADASHDSVKTEPPEDDKSPTKKVKRIKPGVRFGLFFVPIATLISTLLGLIVAMIVIGVFPADRSETMILAVLTFPIFAGCALSYSLGCKTPWRSLLYQLGLCLIFGGTAWLINSWRWGA